MKKSDIIKCLKNNKEISDFELTIKHKESRELFYVLKHLELNRAVNVEEAAVEIYIDKDDMKGNSCIFITAADNIDTLNTKIKSAIVKAKSVMNKYYPLVEKSINLKETKNKKIDLNKTATNIAKAVYRAEKDVDGWINSCEIFVTLIKMEFITSRGIANVTYEKLCQIEIIPTWKKNNEEYELLKFIQTNDFDLKKITEQTKDALILSKYRSEAIKLSNLNIPKRIKVLVQDDMLRDLVNNFATDSSYEYLYLKQNHYKINDIISKTPFSLTLKPFIKGCIASSKYDNHGIKLCEKKIVEKGKLINVWGDIRFGYYLGVDKITGNIPCCSIVAPASSYKKEKHIIIDAFSAPQLEGFSGYFGGEVRLARYFDGKKYIPITGFAISGNIYDAIKNVKFSKEKTCSIDYSGPRYFIFDKLSIN